MNKNFQHVVAVCLAAAASFGASTRVASAHIVESLRVNLPEPVLVGGVVLPAGPCTIQDVGRDEAAAVLLIHSESGMNVSVIAEPIVLPRSGADKTKLVLHREGNAYELDSIWVAGQGLGYHLVSVEGRR